MTREFIAEDLIKSMSDLGTALFYEPKKSDPILEGLMEDAQIQCFLTMAMHLEEYVEDMVDGVDIKSSADETMVNKRMFDIMSHLADTNTISDEEFDLYGKFFASAVVLGCEKQQLHSQELMEFYDASVKEIPEYWHLVYEFMEEHIEDFSELMNEETEHGV